MNEEIRKKLGRNMELTACLNSIKECTEVARGYITHEYEINDVDELIAALASIPEYIKEIEQIIIEITEEYEQEIEVLKHEQL